MAQHAAGAAVTWNLRQSHHLTVASGVTLRSQGRAGAVTLSQGRHSMAADVTPSRVLVDAVTLKSQGHHLTVDGVEGR